MRQLILGLTAAVAAGGSAFAATKPNECAMTTEERAWIDGAIQASDFVMEKRLHLPHEARPTIIVFDDSCRFELKDGASRWVGASHGGKIRLLGERTIDAGVTAMADYDEKTGRTFFVMPLPSIWIAAKIVTPSDRILTGVFLHEFSHTRQLRTLQPVFRAARARFKSADNFNDDSLQAHFQGDPAYVAVYEKETDLLYRAATEPDSTKARALAKQALDLMEARQRRWFTNSEAMWKVADDLFLTMEGFGQWNAYAWLSDPHGGGMTADAAREKLRARRRWWSQDEGLGLFLVIDRFVPNWAAEAFASPPKLGIDLLRRAVAESGQQGITR